MSRPMVVRGRYAIVCSPPFNQHPPFKDPESATAYTKRITLIYELQRWTDPGGQHQSPGVGLVGPTHELRRLSVRIGIDVRGNTKKDQLPTNVQRPAYPRISFIGADNRAFRTNSSCASVDVSRSKYLIKCRLTQSAEWLLQTEREREREGGREGGPWNEWPTKQSIE